MKIWILIAKLPALLILISNLAFAKDGTTSPSCIFDERPSIVRSELNPDRGKDEIFKISGGQTLNGTVEISGSKNALLATIPAALLVAGPVEYKNLPALRDLDTLFALFEEIGVNVTRTEDSVIVNAKGLRKKGTNQLLSPLVSTMRATFHTVGPLISRFCGVQINLPGGCKIGARPIDIHIEGLKKMGANVQLVSGVSDNPDDDYFHADAPEGLTGATIPFHSPSVGATHNIMMAAVHAKGSTTITGGALEPEADELMKLLNNAGADIYHEGQGTYVIKGVDKERLHPKRKVIHRSVGDRIEAASYLMLAAVTKSNVKINGIDVDHIRPVIDILRKLGVVMTVGSDHVIVRGSEYTDLVWPQEGINIIADAYPKFPTDAMAPMIALLTQVKAPEGTKIKVNDLIYENRVGKISRELIKMGAKIDIVTEEVDGKVIERIAYITPGTPLSAADVTATDLRAGFALIMAAMLTEEGQVTTIRDPFWIRRGYSNVLDKLRGIGARNLLSTR